MAAPTIPHLGTLRRGAGAGARGSARGGFTGQANNIDKDRVIRDTDHDASSSRVSAVEASYLEDPFAKVLNGDNWQRRLPLMNRGTYIRTTAIDRIVDTFLSTRLPHSTPTSNTSNPTSITDSDHRQTQRQIVSLGAGSDTRYFRMKRDKKHRNFTYHELDFAENNRTKIARLKDPKCTELINRECEIDLSLAETNADSSELRTDEYFIHTVDLRTLPEQLPWLDTEASTLLISECCLVYLSPDSADNVLQYFSKRLSNASLAVAIYEPFRPNDGFGRTMTRNLMRRGIVLQTIEKYADLREQTARLEHLKMKAKAMDCEQIWQLWIDQSEKDRVDKLEWMDEVEEFVLLARHYCVAWGWRSFPESEEWAKLLALHS